NFSSRQTLHSTNFCDFRLTTCSSLLFTRYRIRIVIMLKVCVCGGGHEGHAIAGMLASHGLHVSVLTRRPQDWQQELTLHCLGKKVSAQLVLISDKPEEVIPSAELIIISAPAF